MFAPRHITHQRTGLAVAAIACISVVAQAQQKEEKPYYDDEVIEEIVVTAGKAGDPIDLEALYEEQLRARLFKEQIRLRELEDDNDWRSSSTTAAESTSRISWGYDPADELRMRRDTHLTDVQWETTKPASLFRVEF